MAQEMEFEPIAVPRTIDDYEQLLWRLGNVKRRRAELEATKDALIAKAESVLAEITEQKRRATAPLLQEEEALEDALVQQANKDRNKLLHAGKGTREMHHGTFMFHRDGVGTLEVTGEETEVIDAVKRLPEGEHFIRTVESLDKNKLKAQPEAVATVDGLAIVFHETLTITIRSHRHGGEPYKVVRRLD